jgi:hypothetical protein
MVPVAIAANFLGLFSFDNFSDSIGFSNSTVSNGTSHTLVCSVPPVTYIHRWQNGRTTRLHGAKDNLASRAARSGSRLGRNDDHDDDDDMSVPSPEQNQGRTQTQR